MRHRYFLSTMSLLLAIGILTPYIPVIATTCPTSGNDVTISVSCIFDAGTYTFTGTLTINAGVTVTAASNVGSGQVVIVSDNIDVQGTISGNGTGFGAANGPAPGLPSGGCCAGGSGGGHGGNGGNSSGGSIGGASVGSVTQPVLLGSGGGNGAGTGGNGGGSLKLQATGTVTVASTGIVTMNANNGTGNGGGGGSGGSVWIDAGTLAGTGIIRANGGNGNPSNPWGGGGGGGRVAIHYTNGNPLLYTMQALPGADAGSTATDGGGGTIYLKSAAATNGDLIVDGNGVDKVSNTTQVSPAGQTFDNVTIRNGARYAIPNTMSLTIPSSGTLTGGGAVRPTLQTDAGGTFNPPTTGAFTFNGINVTNNGTVSTVTNMTLTTSTFIHNGQFSATLTDLTLGSSGTFVVQTLFGLSLSNVLAQNGGTFEQRMLGPIPITTVTVNSGGTLTHTANTTAKAFELNLSSTTIDIQTGGTIGIDAKGNTAASGNGPGLPSGGCCAGGSGGGHGGNGGNSSGGSIGGASNGSVTQPINLGSGGGNGAGTGGSGGGAVKLVVSGTLTVAGTVSAGGGNGTGNGGGGASGGSIWIDAGTLAGTGTIRANGGNGNPSNPWGGGGGGGRVAITYASGNPLSYTLQALGGSDAGSTATDGGSGTIYLKSSVQTNGDLILDGNNNDKTSATTQVSPSSQTYDNLTVRRAANYVVPNGLTTTIASGGTLVGAATNGTITVNSGGIFNLPSATFTLNTVNLVNRGTVGVVQDLTVQSATLTQSSSTGSYGASLSSLTMGGSGILSMEGTSVFTVPTITVNSGGSITHADNAASRANVVNISSTTLTINASGTVTGSNLGFDRQSGTSPGATGSGGGGGGHGGNGGNSSGSAAGGSPYGSVTAPIDLGSGGGTTVGGSGGGAIKFIVSGTFTHNGTISSNGQNGSTNGGGGGAGGSVWIDAGTLAGTGSIAATGGNGAGSAPWGGGGAGGRIAITYASGNPLSYTAQAFGGTDPGSTATDGGAGTIYLKSSAQTNGDLIIDNNNADKSSATTQLAPAIQTYDNLTVRRSASYVIPNSFTTTIASGGTLVGAATNGTITVNSGGIFNLPSATFTLNTVNLVNRGTVGVVQDLTVQSATLTQSSGTGSYSATLNSLIVNGAGILAMEGTGTFTVPTVTVNASGNITHVDNSTGRANVIDISATTATINASGTVNTNGLGFDRQNGTGVGTTGSGGGGGGYGGAGGASSGGAAGGTTYGSSTSPTDIGSGGGSTVGGSGGGAIKFTVSGTMTLAGTISANGNNGTTNGGGGGSGGSVWISAGSITGTGTITANGGNGAGSNPWGGGGGGGRISVGFGGDTSTWTKLANGGANGGGGGAQNGSAGTIVSQQSAPTVTSVTHAPASPTTTDAVTLSGSATYPGLVNKIEIYLDGTDPGNLKHTCNFAPAQSPASCQTNVGFLAGGSHTTTVKAYGVDATVGTGTENFSVSGSTLSGQLNFSRSKVSVSSSFMLSFALSGTSTGTLTVTFPVQFTVTAAGNGGASSGCLSAFGFTATTLTATKTNCSGTVVLGGATVTNPATPGEYIISWTNDSGSGSVFIVSDDQVNVSAAVDPVLTFNVGSEASATACAGSFTGNGGSVALGVLTTSAISSSDVLTVPHICTRLTTNGIGGAAVTVRSLNASLRSTSVPGDAIPSSTSTLVAGTAGYGVCAGSVGADSGLDTTTPAGAAPVRSAPFGGSCTSSAHDVGALTTNPQNIWTVAGPTQNAFVRVYVKAAISPSTPAHSDYTDTLTFIVTGTY